jgi:flavin-dependent dehydrogenase
MDPFGSGWHLDRAAFDESLREQVRFACDSPTSQQNLLIEGKFASVRKDGSEWIVTVETSELIIKQHRSKWLIDASGRKASVARKVHHYFCTFLNRRHSIQSSES